MTEILHSQNTLYFDALDIQSHCCRMLLAYKGIQSDWIPVSEPLPQEVLSLNPHGKALTWVDREVVLYEWWVIMEYLEERYPAPSLLPPVPSHRAQVRMLCHRMQTEWMTRLRQLTLRETAERRPIEQALVDGIVSALPLFEKTPYMGCDVVTFADCLFAAILWRLPSLGVTLPKAALPIAQYAQRIFKEPFFIKSLTPQERALNARKEQTAS